MGSKSKKNGKRDQQSAEPPAENPGPAHNGTVKIAAASFGVLYDRLVEEVQTLGLTWNRDLIRDLPKKWERHGDLILLPDRCFTNQAWRSVGPELWPLVARSLQAKRVGRKRRISDDDYRSPQHHIELMHGEDAWVEHIDNGIRYQYDVTRCMFSIGNINEKIRVGALPCNGQTIVDMFAGIGYFTLPYLVHAGAAHVYAIDWNDAAVEALRRNLQVNNVDPDKCTVIEGDCRKVTPVDVADRVNMGLLPSCHPYWLTACRALRSAVGGVLHVHENVTTSRAPLKHSLSLLNNATKARRQPLKRQVSADATIHETDIEFDVEPGRIDEWAYEDDKQRNADFALTSAVADSPPPGTPTPPLSVDDSGVEELSEGGRATSSMTSFTTDEEERDMSVPPSTPPQRRDSRRLRKMSSIVLRAIDEESLRPYRVKVHRCFAEDWCMKVDIAYKDWALATAQEMLRFLHNIHDEEWSARILRVGKIKQYAPHIDHVVLDLECRPRRLLG